jgi:hypothetical protein
VCADRAMTWSRLPRLRSRCVNLAHGGGPCCRARLGLRLRYPRRNLAHGGGSCCRARLGLRLRYPRRLDGRQQMFRFLWRRRSKLWKHWPVRRMRLQMSPGAPWLVRAGRCRLAEQVCLRTLLCCASVRYGLCSLRAFVVRPSLWTLSVHLVYWACVRRLLRVLFRLTGQLRVMCGCRFAQSCFYGVCQVRRQMKGTWAFLRTHPSFTWARRNRYLTALRREVVFGPTQRCSASVQFCLRSLVC